MLTFQTSSFFGVSQLVSQPSLVLLLFSLGLNPLLLYLIPSFHLLLFLFSWGFRNLRLSSSLDFLNHGEPRYLGIQDEREGEEDKGS